MANHSLDRYEIALLDQVAEEAKRDLDELIAQPAIRAALAEDGEAIATARLTAALEHRFSHTACAGLAAFAIVRLIEQDAEIGRLRSEVKNWQEEAREVARDARDEIAWERMRGGEDR